MSERRQNISGWHLRRLKSIIDNLKYEALRAGQYDPPHSPAIYNDRDKEEAFECFAYIRAVHSIGVLNSIYTFIKETIEMEKVDRRQNTAGIVYLSVRDVQIEIELLPNGALITASIKNGEEMKMLLSESELITDRKVQEIT